MAYDRSEMIQIAEHVPLAPKTTFRIGGPARFFAEIETEDHLLEALHFAEKERTPVFVLGGGSNLLISDSGFPGLVLHLALLGPLVREADFLQVPAGVQWDDLVLHLCEQEVSGMECLAGIPGLVGASPIQNIGAYGQEASRTIHAVRAYDRIDKHFVVLTREDCGFGYRRSIFNTTHRNRYIITQVVFALNVCSGVNLDYPDLRAHFAFSTRQPTPLEVYRAVRSIRQAKGMLLVADGDSGLQDTRSAGSFFKNPVITPAKLVDLATSLGMSVQAVPRYPAPDGSVKVPAAWLLEQAGFYKGYADGEAGISSRHTLALINRGRASHADIARLRDHILETIDIRFHLTLEQEPVEL